MKKSFKLIAAALAAITAMSCTSATAFAEKINYKNDVDKDFYESLLKVTEGYRGSKYMNKVTSEDENIVEILPAEKVKIYNDGFGAIVIDYSVDFISEKIRKDKNFDLTVTYEFYVSDEIYYDYSFSVLDRNVFTISELRNRSEIPENASITAIRIKEAINIDKKFSQAGAEEYESYWDAVTAKYIGNLEHINSTNNSWIKIGGKKYYVNSKGIIETKSCIIEGVMYKFSSNGECIGKYTGWAKTSKGNRYYKNGIMLKNRWIKTKSGKRYYAGSDGYMTIGWKKLKNGWHWFDNTGAEATGIVDINGSKYTFSKSGVWDGIGTLDIGTTKYAVENKMSDEIYGGIYNDSGIIVILSTDVDAAKQTIDELYPGTAQIIIQKCNFTFKYLSDVKKAISEKRVEFNIGVSTDTPNNCVVVSGVEFTKELKAFIENSGFSNCVRYEKTSGESIDD
ncbi:MAG: hypothetical protein IK990_15500 [Ruminiclostridium sp.]|nr:hypothetical protein [Ruminiclostridium sp.]